MISYFFEFSRRWLIVFIRSCNLGTNISKFFQNKSKVSLWNFIDIFWFILLFTKNSQI